MASEKQFKRQMATWYNAHIRFAIIVADPSAPPLEAQILQNYYNLYFDGDMVDDDYVDAGSYDWNSISGIYIQESANDPTKLDELEDRFVPVFTDSGFQALDTLLIGSSAGGAGVSYGTTAAQTQIDIVDDTHNITKDFPLGALTIQAAGNLNWVRAADLVADAIILATIQGDATKVVLAVLPTEGANINGDESPGVRYFMGTPEFDIMTGSGYQLVGKSLDYGFQNIRNISINAVLAEITSAKKARQRMAPDLATGVQLTGALAAWTYGGASVVIPIGSIPRRFRLLQVHVEEFSDSTDTYQIEFRKVTAGTVLATIKFSAPIPQTVVNLGIRSRNIAAPDGVEARVATKNGGNATIRISLGYERG